MKREGIAFAGNLIVDHIFEIERLPDRSELARIYQCTTSTGGCVTNTAIDMATLAPDLPVFAYGVAGEDADGDLILQRLHAKGIHTQGVVRRGVTSFTEVYAERATGCRTFFQYGGGGDTFDVEDLDFSKISARMLHAGYLLLLERLDSPDPEYGTRMARLLHKARLHGCATSIDVVSETGDRFAKIVLPALPYVDYLIINELEAGKITGMALLDESGAPIPEMMRLALQKLLDLGVSRWAIIHAASGAYGLDAAGQFSFEPSKRLPQGFIVGTVGAGDAFCAGALLAAYQEQPIAQALRYGNAAALQALRGATATDSMRSLEESLAFYDAFDQAPAT